MKKIIEVLAAIIKQDNKYFATQRGYGEFKDGWEFPGGKIEKNETRQEALRTVKWLPADIKIVDILTKRYLPY